MSESPKRNPRRLSWIPKYGPISSQPTLPTPQEGQELSLSRTPSNLAATPTSEHDFIPFTRTDSIVSNSPNLRPSSAPSSRPSTPIFSSKRWSSSPVSTVLTAPSSNQQPGQTSPPNGSGRTSPAPLGIPPTTANSIRAPELSKGSSGSFSKMAFNSVMGGLSALSLSRTSTSDDPRGRTELKSKSRSNSVASGKDKDAERSRSRARSQSPFSFRRFRSRDNSPTPVPLEESDTECVRRTSTVRPKTAFTDDPDSESDFGGDETEDDEDDWSDEGLSFDPLTERNTEQNALIIPLDDGLLMDAEVDPDPLGEGVNVVVPPEPYFPSTLNRTSVGSMSRKRGGAPKRKKSRHHHEALPHSTSRPIFQRDRCTINITQGDPDAVDGKKRSFVVASDMSEESRYAAEWGIGTVLRDGDEMIIVTIVENESKVDPPAPGVADRAVKLRSQQERQGLAYILVRQATSLLQRTKLNVVVSCQAWHAKNARHMLLDIVDYNEPAMLIVGSRGISQLKGILLGSTSHYLIEKCSVPVMVARRRLKRPPRRSAHLTKNRAHVSLAEAGIDRVAPRVDQDVAVMRDEIQRDEDRRDGVTLDGEDEREEREDIEEGEEVDDSELLLVNLNQKVAG